MHYVYVLECSDKTLYVGVTNDLERRLRAHNGLKSGARYTKTRRPVTIKYKEAFRTRSRALSREYVIKQLTRSQKITLLRSEAL